MTNETRPNSVSLAIVTASSSVSKGISAATGPKISVVISSDSGETPVSTVGG